MSSTLAYGNTAERVPAFDRNGRRADVAVPRSTIARESGMGSDRQSRTHDQETFCVLGSAAMGWAGVASDRRLQYAHSARSPFADLRRRQTPSLGSHVSGGSAG